MGRTGETRLRVRLSSAASFIASAAVLTAIPVGWSTIARGAPADEGTSPLEIDSTPRPAKVWIGLTPVGETKTESHLRPGVYVITLERAGFLPASKTISIVSGKRTRLRVHLSRTTDRRPRESARRNAQDAQDLSSRPAWTQDAVKAPATRCRDGRGDFCGVGIAGRAHGPVLGESMAYVRAMTELARLATRSRTRPEERIVGDSEMSEATLAAPRLEETWADLNGVHFALVSVQLDRASRSARSAFMARGGGNVVTFGSSGSEVVASAEVAAVSTALLRLAIERRDLRVTSMKIDRAAPEAQETQSTTKVYFDETLAHARARIRLRATYRDHQRLRRGPKDTLEDEQGFEHTLAIDFDGPKGGGRLRLLQGVLHAQAGSKPSEIAARLVAAASGLGIELTHRRSLDPAFGAPIVEIRLEAPPGQLRD